MSSKKENFMKKIKPWLRSLVAFVLVMALVLGNAHEAFARRGSGRIGGGSFRAPTRSVPNPSINRGNYSGGNNYNYYGGGYGSGGGLFFLPFLFSGGGGGGLLGMLVLLAIAGAVLQAFRGTNGQGISGIDSKVTVAKIQVGLLSSARSLQANLSRLALEADTSSSEGLALVLREVTVSLLRHPEYWVYASSAKESTKLELAEQRFNSLAMSERSKLNEEVLSNVNNRLIEGSSPTKSLSSSGEIALEEPTEYIVVTLLVAAAGDPLGNVLTIRSADQLKQSLSAIGAVPADQLLAVEVLWEPQSEEYTLSSDEVIGVYPDLVRI